MNTTPTQIDYDFRGRTQCAQCDQVVLHSDALVVTKHVGRNTVTEHFCGEHCANEFYLEQLRRVGL